MCEKHYSENMIMCNDILSPQWCLILTGVKWSDDIQCLVIGGIGNDIGIRYNSGVTSTSIDNDGIDIIILMIPLLTINWYYNDDLYDVCDGINLTYGKYWWCVTIQWNSTKSENGKYSIIIDDDIDDIRWWWYSKKGEYSDILIIEGSTLLNSLNINNGNISMILIINNNNK